MLFLAYIVVMMLCLQMDALACVAAGKKFNLAGGTIACLVWPVSVPITIYIIWKGASE